MRRVRTGEIVAGVAGAVLLLSTFLEWYTVRGRAEGLTAWSAFSFVDLLVALVAVLGITLAASQVIGRGPALPVAIGVITTTLALAATLLVLYRILNQPGPNDVIGVAAGAWLGRGRPTRCRRCPSAARPRRAPKISGMSLSRDQVLHVARLARLELTEAEIERFGTELSKVLDHIETIGELGDMEDVEPTSHVVAVENALRADEPQPSLSQEAALAAAPDVAQGGFRVPSPGAGGGA